MRWPASAAGGGGGGGGAGAAMGSTKNAFTADAGSGSWSAESSGTITIRAAAIACSASETGIVFDCCVLWATRSESMRSSKSLLFHRRPSTCFALNPGPFGQETRILVPGSRKCQGCCPPRLSARNATLRATDE